LDVLPILPIHLIPAASKLGHRHQRWHWEHQMWPDESSGHQNANGRIMAFTRQQVPSRNKEEQIIQCKNPLKNSELRHLATIYEFPIGNDSVPSPAVEMGGNLNCSFNKAAENCSWYAVNFGTERKKTFRRARFESFFDWEKFDCTSDRAFTFG
jgi:hypothetical protein